MRHKFQIWYRSEFNRTDPDPNDWTTLNRVTAFLAEESDWHSSNHSSRLVRAARIRNPSFYSNVDFKCVSTTLAPINRMRRGNERRKTKKWV